MMDQASLRNTVFHLRDSQNGVVEAAVTSHDGLVLMSTFEDEDQSDIFTAMASEVLQKSSQMTSELSFGDVWGTMIFGTIGGIVSRIINEEMVLIAHVTPEAQISAVIDEMNRLVSKLQIE